MKHNTYIQTTEKIFCIDCGIVIGWDFRYDIPLGCEWKDGWRCVKCHTRKFKPPIIARMDGALSIK